MKSAVSVTVALSGDSGRLEMPLFDSSGSSEASVSHGGLIASFGDFRSLLGDFCGELETEDFFTGGVTECSGSPLQRKRGKKGIG